MILGSIPGALLLLFVTLKLCGVVAWPWVWVLMPGWLPLTMVLALVLLAWMVEP